MSRALGLVGSQVLSRGDRGYAVVQDSRYSSIERAELGREWERFFSMSALEESFAIDESLSSVRCNRSETR